jgi:ABC-type lipoprotein export system ATPase subunit
MPCVEQVLVSRARSSARDRKKIVVVVTHDRVLAERVATKRVRLERGRVV